MVVFMGSQQNKITGRFMRKHEIWTGVNWNDGYLDNRGRFRVYRPDYPRVYNEGYALRAHVVWWLHKRRCHPKNMELHHKDGNRVNDVITNLQPLSNSQHQKFHRPTPFSTLTCLQCNKRFRIESSRVRSRPTKYCSQRCYHLHPKSNTTKVRASRSMKKVCAERTWCRRPRKSQS